MSLTRLFNRIYILTLSLKAKRFNRSLENSIVVQQDILLGLIRNNENTAFGLDHKFSLINNYEDFKKNIPILEYIDLINYIEKIKVGEENVLTSHPVKMFEKTSGSTQGSKYIPYTKELLNEFQNATGAWLYDLYTSYPKLKNGRSYWSISPKFGEHEVTSGGIDIGFENDLDYFSKGVKFFLKKVLIMPNNVTRATVEEFQLRTALALIEARDLSLISVWSPTFLTEILDYIEKNLNKLTPELSLSALKRISLNRGHVEWNKLWPKLRLISCWTEGSSELFYNNLRARLGKIAFQGKGLLLTEGVISFPLVEENASILAITSHFYEFLDMQNNVHLPHELIIGERYIPIITTGGGLYRYKTNDIVEVIQFKNKVPLLKFIARSGVASDLCGEKLDEEQVKSAVTKLLEEFNIVPKFAFVAPEVDDNNYYILFLENEGHDSGKMEKRFDEILRESFHYDLCRKLGQLRAVEIVVVKDGSSKYRTEIVKRKNCKGLGDIKPCYLEQTNNWKSIMDGTLE